MSQGKLRVATCQFPVGRSIERNGAYIRRLMGQAKKKRAEIVHFSECSLSGYAGVDLPSMKGFDWDLLRAETTEIIELAAKLKLWVVLGSAHELSGKNRPHNSLYLITPDGRIKDRYDKRFCTGSDVNHYSAGDHFSIFTINGIKCALLICFDLRFPELYRELKRKKVECIFQSFYNARQKGRTIHTDIMRQSMQCRAATNYFWVSMTNSCAFRSPYPSCMIQPDGKISGILQFHRPGVMVNTVDTTKELYDASVIYRNKTMKGALSGGTVVKDARSRRRTTL